MKPVHLEAFMKFIEYTPKHIGRDLGDGWRIVQFRDWKDKSAHIEYGTDTPQRIYFEIVDWKDYVDGDVIPLDSDRRLVKLYLNLTWDNIQECAEQINEALNKLYGTRKTKKCSFSDKNASDISQL